MGGSAADKSPCDIFIYFAHYFQLNLYENSLLCNEGTLRIIGGNDKPHHKKSCSDSRFSIKFLRVVSAAGVNVPVIFMAKGENVHQWLRNNNLVTKYGITEGSYMIPNKAEYMDDET